MNIAVNTRLLLHGKMEGIGRYIFETTRRIVKLNPQHQFYFFFDRAFHKDFIFESNVIGKHIFPPTRHPILINWWFEKQLPRYFKKYNIDLFLSGDNLLSLSTNVPTILVSHDLAFHHFPEHLPLSMRKFYSKYSEQYHHKASKIIAVSASTKKDIETTYQIEPSKIVVAGNDAPSGFLPLTEPEKQEIRDSITNGEKYFIYLGAIHPRKNILRLLQAFEDFKSNGKLSHKLVLVGRKAWKNSELMDYFNGMQYKSDVVFMDHVSEEVHGIMGSAEALVYVSLFEGFGIPILEAFHAGVPVITSNISSMPGVAGDAAILVDPYNIISISEALSSIATDHKKCLEMIDKGMLQKKKFSWDISAKIISDLINELP